MKKTLASVAAALLVGGTLTLVSALPASATAPVGECVPSDAIPAWTEVVPDIEHAAVPAVTHDEFQRYSWTGGPSETAPVETPPSDNWQANTTNYEGAGHGTDPIGVAFPKNDSGKGDWFFWTKTTVVDTPAVDAYTEVVPDIEHPAVDAVTCEPEAPAPVVCNVTGDWYTEGDDLAPVATADGLLFTGGSGKAVGYRVPVSGNLQGWTSLSFDASNIDQFFFRLVIDASADGGPSYKSLSFPGYTTVDQTSVSYQYGETLAATAVRFPNAVITSIGFQTNSGAPEGYESVLSSVTGCATVDFGWTVPEQPEDNVVVTTDEDVDCETGVVTITTTTVTTGTAYNEQTNTWDATEPVTTVTTDTREATAEECPVVVPPTEEPTATPTPTETPVPVAAATTATPTADTLASTGGDNGLLGLLIAGILALGGTALFAANHVLRTRNRS